MTPEALARLHAQASDTDRAWSAAEFAALLESRHTLLIASAQGFALGRVIADEAELLMLATRPDSRRSGHARRALDAFHAQSHALGARRAFLEVAADNAPARALYDSAGYVETARRRQYYARKGALAVDACLMQRDLT